ncbi:hypothetical protein BSKO_06750 [Bryopsis sp. KO-2023]|nr:hypothetical protein BSKO_06750 [Bryopsis sp. KO-2023]
MEHEGLDSGQEEVLEAAGVVEEKCEGWFECVGQARTASWLAMEHEGLDSGQEEVPEAAGVVEEKRGGWFECVGQARTASWLAMEHEGRDSGQEVLEMEHGGWLPDLLLGWKMEHEGQRGGPPFQNGGEWELRVGHVGELGVALCKEKNVLYSNVRKVRKEVGYEDSYLSCNSGRPAKKHWRRNRLQLRKFAPDTSRIHFKPRETVVVSVGRKPCHEEDSGGGREPGVAQFGVIPAVEKHTFYCVQVHPVEVNLMFCKKEDGRRRRGEKKLGVVGAVAQIAQL